MLLPLLVMLAAATACREPDAPGAVRVAGHVEATEVQVSSEVGGRILELRVAEGDRVTAGTVVALLDTRDIDLQLQRARAERGTAEAQLRLLEAGARDEEIRQAEAQVQAAEAEAAGAASELKAAELDLERFESLLEADAGSRKQRDDALARVELARERVRAAQARIGASRETAARLRAGPTREELDTARARIAVADAQIAVLDKAKADASVVAPATGVVTLKLTEPGELVAPRMPLFVITDLDNAWANLFVPEPLIPEIALGQAATIIDDAGGRIEGKVTYISPQAEFTPRNVQTADERSKLVYRIKVSVDNRSGTLKPGMPVDAELTAP
jgi:HlyD family secretion protein